MTLKSTMQDSIKELQEADRVTITDGDHEVDIRTNYIKDEPVDLNGIVTHAQQYGLDRTSGKAQPVSVDGDGVVDVSLPGNATSSPVYVQIAGPIVSNTALSKQITSSSAQVSITNGGLYILTATDQDCYILTGSNPTAAISADGHNLIVPQGASIGPIRINADKIAYIGASATTGYLCITAVTLA